MRIGPYEFGVSLRRSEKGARVTSLGDQARAMTLAQNNGKTIEGDAFGPGTPLQATYPAGSEPRRIQYPIGYNYAQRPRSTEKISFQTLRDLAVIYDVARACIETRKKEIKALDWDIVARDEGEGAKHKDQIREIRSFFTKPDQEHYFDQWLNALGEDRFVIDALTIFKRKTRGGKLYALEPVDGATVKPLLDVNGRTPVPPNPAYQQFVYGIPFYEFTKDELLYRPENVRTVSPYGLAPLEWLLLTINTDVKLQWNFLYYFTEGNIPEGFGTTPETWTPKQIEEWQQIWDALMLGDETMKRRIRFMPGGFKFTQFREPKFDTAFPEFLLKKTCMAFEVQPQELGFTTHVNRATGEMQENIQYRRSLKPICQFFAGIFNEVISTDFKAPHLQFKWLGLEEAEDAHKQAQVDEIYIKNGVISPDEVREKRLGMDLDTKHKVGRLFMTGSGPVFVEELLEKPKNPPTQLTPPPGTTPSPESGPPEDDDDDDDEDVSGQEAEEVRRELKRWEKMACKRVNAGKAMRKFESAVIPESIRRAIEARLAGAASVGEVKKAFDLAKRRRVRLKKHLDRIKEEQTRLAGIFEGFLPAEGKKIAHHIVGGLFKGTSPQDLVKSSKDDEEIDLVIDGYDWGSWAKSLEEPVKKQIKRLFGAGVLDAFGSLKVEIDFDVDSPKAEECAAERAAELVGKGKRKEYAITETTRKALRTAVTNALDDGLSSDELRDAIIEDHAFSQSRAWTIARTETGFAYNRGTITGYRESGLVKTVRVLDGDYDEECQNANGQVWDLEYAEAHPLEHPNCVRAFEPIVE